jgi:hypothetical protein
MKRLFALFLLSASLAHAQQTVTLPDVVKDRGDLYRNSDFVETRIGMIQRDGLRYALGALSSEPLLFWEEYIDGTWQRTDWPSLDLTKMERLSYQKGLTFMVPQNAKSNPFRVYLYFASTDDRKGNYVLVGEKDAPASNPPKPTGTKYLLGGRNSKQPKPAPNGLRNFPNIIMNTAGSTDPAVYAVTTIAAPRRTLTYSYSSSLNKPTLFWEEEIDGRWQPTDWPTPDLSARQSLRSSKQMLVPVPKNKTANPFRVYLYFAEEDDRNNGDYVMIAEGPISPMLKPFE